MDKKTRENGQDIMSVILEKLRKHNFSSSHEFDI